MPRKHQHMFLGFLLTAYLLGLAGCSDKSTPADTTPPDPPVLLPSPADSSWDETGTDAIPDDNYIQLVWLMGSEDDLSGYKIYRSSPPLEILTLLATKTLGSGVCDTVYDDQSVEIGVRYSYIVTAFDQAGNESEWSEEMDYMLIPKLSDENLTSPRGEIGERQPTFIWISTGESMANYLRVYDVLDERTVWVSPGQNPFSSPHSLLYNEDGMAADTLLTPGRQYWWRVDRQGSELRSGSESRWVSFTVK